jgi:hypothetical protein
MGLLYLYLYLYNCAYIGVTVFIQCITVKITDEASLYYMLKKVLPHDDKCNTGRCSRNTCM